MTRTRGAHLVGGESSEQGQRIRPTTSTRKRAHECDAGVPRVDVVHEHQHVDDGPVVDEPQNVGEMQEEHEKELYILEVHMIPLLLTSYSDHVACLLWRGKVSVVLNH
ncbi:hypothetical protein DEO72_LG6g1620 [Vigna unguiculata]|uniref:Uncharacterized protein n=1 Tax=Vigna unguiculata TaxID=3917 RepID=A0A4D6M896_VIGUN|nr:hypothetical protein DEO72_LG6g1620 [Vigna unguiculata]